MKEQKTKFRRLHHGRVDECQPRADRIDDVRKRGYLPVGDDGLTDIERAHLAEGKDATDKARASASKAEAATAKEADAREEPVEKSAAQAEREAAAKAAAPKPKQREMDPFQ